MRPSPLRRYGMLLTILAALGCSETPNEPTPMGLVILTSEPSRASITVDDSPTGTFTPDTLSLTANTTHIILLQKPGYHDWQTSVYVHEWSPSERRAQLELLPGQVGTVVLTSNPSGSVVSVDGRPVGSTPLVWSGEAGDYTFRLLHASYFPEDTTLSVVPLDTTVVGIAHDPTPPYLVTFSHGDTLFQVSCDAMSNEALAVDYSWSGSSGRGFAWSPNGEMYTYAQTGSRNVIIRDRNNALIRSITTNRNSRSRDMSWSHDSRLLAFGWYYSGVYVYDVVDDELARIVGPSGSTYDHNPVFSPDDQRIAYAHHFGGGLAYVNVVNADGSDLQRFPDLLHTSYDEFLDIRWLSNDQFLFRLTSGGIYVADARTLTIEIVSDAAAGAYYSYDVSADATKVFYYKDYRTGIHMLRADDWSDVAVPLPISSSHLRIAPNNESFVLYYRGIAWADMQTRKAYQLVQWTPGYSSYYPLAVTPLVP